MLLRPIGNQVKVKRTVLYKVMESSSKLYARLNEVFPYTSATSKSPRQTPNPQRLIAFSTFSLASSSHKSQLKL